MKRTLVLVYALLAFLSASTALQADREAASPAPPGPARTELSYTIEPVVSGKTLIFNVDLTLVGDDTGTVRLHLPDHFAGQGQLYRCVQDLHPVSPGVTIADTKEPQIKAVTFPPGQTVRLAYRVVQDWTGPLDGEDGYFRPILQPKYFHVIGSGFWVYPSIYTPRVAVTLHWKGLPPGWTLAGSFGLGAQEQRFDGTLEQFLEGISVGGDFRLLTATVGGKPVTLAIRGKWKFTDAAYAETVTRILQAERDFWRDDDFPTFLVTLIPTEGASQGAAEAGVELTNAVALFQPGSAPLDAKFRYLVAHELFHTWNADKIQTSPAYLWFSEGFTDYYARLLLLRAGMMTLPEYAGEENARLREYYLSPARNRPAEEVSANFFTDARLQRVPYLQGALLACHWNTAIRAATQGRSSLDDVMRDLLAACRGQKASLTQSLLTDAVARYAAVDVAGDVQKDITDGGTISPDPGGLGPEFAMETKPVPTYELGFDESALTKERTIHGVKAGSSAAYAGLRDGQEVVGFGPFVPGDPSQRISITVKDHTGTSQIEFYPTGPAVAVPQYARPKRAPGPADESSLAWFGVGGRPGVRV